MVRRSDGEWSDLVPQEPKSFGDVEVFELCHLNCVQINDM